MPAGFREVQEATPTVRRQRREVRLGARSDPATSTATLFLIHDGQGEMLHYRQLAECLGPDFVVYGLYPMRGDVAALSHTRIDEIADEYIRRVRSRQPHGPYMLGGLCAGGVIAHAMACRLEEGGEVVAMLALIDASNEKWWKRLRWSLRRQIASLHREVPTPIDAGSPALLKSTWKLAVVLRQKCATLARAAATTRKLRALRDALDAGRTPPGFVRDLSVLDICDYAIASHVARRFHGDALLFRATQGNGDPGDEPIRHRYRDPVLGWGDKVGGTLRCIDVNGGHYSLLEEPRVQTVADHIRACAGAKPTSANRAKVA